MADVDKHIDKGEALLAKNKLDGALEEFKAAYEGAKGNLNLLQQIADLCVRLDRKDEAAQYYGDLFDMACGKGDLKRASVIFPKLQDTPQPPERYAKYAALLVNNKKNPEALKAYDAAIEMYEKAGNGDGVLECLEGMVRLDPDKAEIQIRLGEQADKMGKAELAANGLLRGGQLIRPDDAGKAAECFRRAHDLKPDRSTALNLAEVLAERNESGAVISLLQPLYASGEKDPAVMETLGGALVAQNRMDEAEEIIMALQDVKPESFVLLFELTRHHYKNGNDEKGAEVLAQVRTICTKAHREKEYGERLQQLYSENESNLSLGEFIAAYFSESNQETRYESILDGLFKAYVKAEKFDEAANALDRLIDIDPYDFKNQDRFKQLKGKIDDKHYGGMGQRISADMSAGGGDGGGGGGGDAGEVQALDDMIVQVELFIQYNLQAKAVEKLQEIAIVYPGMETSNPRLMKLYEQAEIKPPGAGAAPSAAAAAAADTPAAAPAAAPAPAPQESVSDLAKISEITHAIYRKGSSKEIIHAAITELGKYLRASRCLGILGKPGKPPQAAVEFCSPGVPQTPAAAQKKLLKQVYQLNLDPNTGAVTNASLMPELAQFGVQSLLAMPLIDTEKQEQDGVLILSQADSPRQWNPNEVYLVKAVADQTEAAISHTKLRSMMANLSVGEADGGLLGRSVYLDTITSVVERSKKQGTPMVIALFEMDRGSALTREAGEAAVDQVIEQAAEILLSQIRQNDMAFRHSGTSLAVMLGDTTMAKCRSTLDKIRRRLCTVKMVGQNGTLTFCAGACEAVVRPEYEAVDIVIDVVNRAETFLDKARQKGNTVMV